MIVISDLFLISSFVYCTTGVVILMLKGLPYSIIMSIKTFDTRNIKTGYINNFLIYKENLNIME